MFTGCFGRGGGGGDQIDLKISPREIHDSVHLEHLRYDQTVVKRDVGPGERAGGC